MITQHMRFTASAIVPTGDFLAHVGDWTGCPPAELLGLMRGAAPVSAGAPTSSSSSSRRSATTRRAQSCSTSDDDPGACSTRCASSTATPGAACTAYLDLVGYRPLDGFDISEPRRSSCPTRCCARSGSPRRGTGATESDVEAQIAEIRDKVPEEHRAEFDELLGEARLTYRLRDERGVYSDIWASGIMRRAALAAGRRVAATGRIHDPEHFVDAGFDEMCALVTGSGRPVGRRARRARRVPHHAHRQGRARVPRPPAAPAAGPVGAAARCRHG